MSNVLGHRHPARTTLQEASQSLTCRPPAITLAVVTVRCNVLAASAAVPARNLSRTREFVVMNPQAGVGYVGEGDH